jgi:hypothetical protein
MSSLGKLQFATKIRKEGVNKGGSAEENSEDVFGAEFLIKSESSSTGRVKMNEC